MDQPSAMEVTRQLGGKWHGAYGMVCCPAHADKTPSCTVKDGDKSILVHCFAGCEWKDVLDAMENQGVIPQFRPDPNFKPQPRRELPPPPPPVRNEKAFAFAQGLWRNSQPAHGTLAETYHRSRAITIALPPCVRFSPQVKCMETGANHPAVLYGYTNGKGVFDGVHLVFLKDDGSGKLPIGGAKITLGTLLGSAIKMEAPEAVDGCEGYFEELGLLEGPEDALSVLQMSNVPTWAAGGGERIAGIDLGGLYKRIWIYGDNGPKGEAFAKKASRSHIKSVSKPDGIPQIGKVFPPSQYDDYNAQLQAEAQA